MAVTELVLNSATGQRSGSADVDGRQYNIVGHAITNDPTDGPAVIFAALGRAIGETYGGFGNDNERDDGSFLQRVEVQEAAQDGRQWQIRLSYGPPRLTSGNGFGGVPQTENPLDAAPDVRWDAVQWEEIVDEDVNGEPVVNSAGDPFDPPVTRDQSRATLFVLVNWPEFADGYADLYRDTINSTPFFGRPPKTAKVQAIRAQRVYSTFLANNGYESPFYWQVTFEFAFNRFGWDKRILDAGLREEYLGEQIAILDGKGLPTTVPVPLDGAGQQNGPDDDPQYLTFQIYEAIDFGTVFGFGG